MLVKNQTTFDNLGKFFFLFFCCSLVIYGTEAFLIPYRLNIKNYYKINKKIEDFQTFLHFYIASIKQYAFNNNIKNKYLNKDP